MGSDSSGSWAAKSLAKEQDARARTVVRNAMTILETLFVTAKTFDPAYATPEALGAIDRHVTFLPIDIPQTGDLGISASAKDSSVNYTGQQAGYKVGTVSESGRIYCVLVDKAADGEPSYFWVDEDGTHQDW
jgi:hypothetical protein